VNFRTTGILVAVLIVLAGVVYFLQQQPTPKETAAKANTPQIVSFSSSQATKLTISGGSNTTEIQRSANGWDLVRPEPTPADSTRVNGWVDQLGNLTADRVIDSPSDLGTYGLAQPKLNLEVDVTGSAPVKLAFGDKTPDGADYYVRLPDDATKSKSVYLVGATLGDDLNSALTKPPKAIPTPTPAPTLKPGPSPAGPTGATPSAGTPAAGITPTP
jgi:Domain of unknown function (DUF4340)